MYSKSTDIEDEMCDIHMEGVHRADERLCQYGTEVLSRKRWILIFSVCTTILILFLYRHSIWLNWPAFRRLGER